MRNAYVSFVYVFAMMCSRMGSGAAGFGGGGIVAVVFAAVAVVPAGTAPGCVPVAPVAPDVGDFGATAAPPVALGFDDARFVVSAAVESTEGFAVFAGVDAPTPAFGPDEPDGEDVFTAAAGAEFAAGALDLVLATDFGAPVAPVDPVTAVLAGGSGAGVAVAVEGVTVDFVGAGVGAGEFAVLATGRPVDPAELGCGAAAVAAVGVGLLGAAAASEFFVDAEEWPDAESADGFPAALGGFTVIGAG
jgi:hypothetical protein